MLQTRTHTHALICSFYSYLTKQKVKLKDSWFHFNPSHALLSDFLLVFIEPLPFGICLSLSSLGLILPYFDLIGSDFVFSRMPEAVRTTSQYYC